MDQHIRKCPREAVLPLFIKQEASPREKQSILPEMRHRERIQGTCSQHNPGNLLTCFTQFALCWFLLGLWFAFPQNCFLPTLCKSFMIPPPHQAFSLFWISPLPSRVNITDVHPTLHTCLADSIPSSGFYHPLKATASTK